MTDTTAKIRAKGLDTTGVTEDIALQMYGNKGRHYMAIVELKVDETHEKSDGTRKVDLIITQLEPAGSDHVAEHLRELTRVAYYNRQNNGDQPLLMGADEPTMDGVLRDGERFRPHPFLPVNAGENDQPICDVCGLLETAPQHSTQEMLEEDPDDDDAPDPAAEPHDFEQGPDDSCLHCGQAYHEPDDEADEPEQDEEPEADPDPADEQSPVNHGFDTPFGGPFDATPERHLAPVNDPFTPKGA